MTDITTESYIETQRQILHCAEIVAVLPLAAFLEKINVCESIAPRTDPTLWRQGHKKLQLIKELANGLEEFQRIVKGQIETKNGL